jgi:D-alanyl-D-alanine carboxypeptidase
VRALRRYDRAAVRRCAAAVATVLGLLLVGAGAAGAPERLDAAVARFAKQHPTFPGVALAVASPAVTWTGAAGAIAPDASFRMASVTKTFTAAAILRLVEEGRIDLDAPIARYLEPATVALLREDGYDVDAIHVRHLLTHTSGVYDYYEDRAYLPFVLAHRRHRWTRMEQLRFAIKHGRPYGPPGLQFRYSDTDYILLGEMLERVTGRGLAAAYRSLLHFDRLGLHETYLETLEPKPPKTKPRAHQYYGTIDTTGFDPSFDLYGAGGLVSTVGDLARFYRALFGGRVFEKPATLRTMLGKPYPVSPTDLGMGVFSTVIGGQSCFGHSGFWGTTVVHCGPGDITMALAVNQSKGFHPEAGQGFDPPSRRFLGTVLELGR